MFRSSSALRTAMGVLRATAATGLGSGVSGNNASLDSCSFSLDSVHLTPSRGTTVRLAARRSRENCFSQQSKRWPPNQASLSLPQGLRAGLYLADKPPGPKPGNGRSTPGGKWIPTGSGYAEWLLRAIRVPYPRHTGTQYCCCGCPVHFYCGSKRGRCSDYCSNSRRAAVRLRSLLVMVAYGDRETVGYDSASGKRRNGRTPGR